MDIDLSQLTTEEIKETSLFKKIREEDWVEFQNNVYLTRLTQESEPPKCIGTFDVYDLNGMVVDHPKLRQCSAKFWIPIADEVVLWRIEGTQPIKYLADIWSGPGQHAYSVLNSAETQPVYRAYAVKLSSGLARPVDLFEVQKAISVTSACQRLIDAFLESRVDGKQIAQGLLALDLDLDSLVKSVKIIRSHLGGWEIIDGEDHDSVSWFCLAVNKVLETVD